MIVRKRMTIRAEQLQIHEPIVKPITIHMMQLNRNRLAQPLTITAPLAKSLL